MNGVTGRMGTNQHLIRSIKAIRDQGGLKVGDDLDPHARPDPHRPQRHDKLQALAERTGVTPLHHRSRCRAGQSRRRDLLRCLRHAATRGLRREGREGQESDLLRKTDGGGDRGGAAPGEALRRRGREERRGAGQALALGHPQVPHCCGTRASSAASSACAASSATGSSPAKMATSRRSARRGTTARKTAAASSSTCSATGAM